MKILSLFFILPFLFAATTADRNVVVTAPSKSIGLSSPPTFPLAHGLTVTPSYVHVKNKDGGIVGSCEFDAINLTACELPSPIDVSNPVTILVQAGANGAPLVSATDTVEGAISLGQSYTWSAPQTFTQKIQGDIEGQSGSQAITFTANSSLNTTNAATVRYAKVGKLVTVSIPELTFISGGSDVALTSNTGIPVEYRPSARIYSGSVAVKNVPAQDESGFVRVNTDGTIVFYRVNPATSSLAWNSGGTRGTHHETVISYFAD